ncbi:MAG: hypothetical protein KIT19_09350 [Phycisphaeraceae bacterium]|nr:hypothetical protein [Phycisphaeraceae bacterium]
MTHPQSIRDAYWAETLWKRRSLRARLCHVGGWFFVIPAVLAWIIIPIVRGGWIGVAASLLIIASIISSGYLADYPDRKNKRRMADLRARRYRTCPCGYDLAGSPDAGTCPECGNTYNPQSLYEHWEGGTYEQVVAKTWPPLGERRMWRALAWWQLASIIAAPLVFFLARELFPRAGVVVVTVFLAAVVSLLLYILRGHVFEWRTLTRQRFRRCPCCLHSLRNAPAAGASPKCRLEYTPDWLEQTWRIIYRRPAAQPGSDTPP